MSNTEKITLKNTKADIYTAYTKQLSRANYNQNKLDREKVRFEQDIKQEKESSNCYAKLVSTKKDIISRQEDEIKWLWSILTVSLVLNVLLFFTWYF